MKVLLIQSYLGAEADVPGHELGRVFQAIKRNGRSSGGRCRRTRTDGKVWHDRAPGLGCRAGRQRWNPVVLGPERFAADSYPRVAPSVDGGLPSRQARPSLSNSVFGVSVLLPERSAFGGLATLS